MSEHRTIAATVSIAADGTVTDAPTRDARITVDSDRIAIDADLDLGIAGQTVSISFSKGGLAAAVRGLAPIDALIPGEIVRDIESGVRAVVRQVLDDDVYEVSAQALGTYRRQGAYLARPRTMEADQ